METNIAYLKQHFLNESAVTAASGCCSGAIRTFTRAGLAPKASYFPDAEGRLSSNLGHCNEMLDTPYYHHAAPVLFKQLKLLVDAGADLTALQDGLRQEFLSAYENHLLTLHIAGLIEADVWHADFRDESARREIAINEFGHWLAGTYGVCTRDNTPQAIAVKESMVRNIDYLTDRGGKDALSGAARERIVQYVRIYDHIAAAFAPFERLGSSRHRICNQLPEKYALALA